MKIRITYNKDIDYKSTAVEGEVLAWTTISSAVFLRTTNGPSFTGEYRNLSAVVLRLLNSNTIDTFRTQSLDDETVDIEVIGESNA